MIRTRVPFTELAAVGDDFTRLDPTCATSYLGGSVAWHRDPDTVLLVSIYGLHRPDGGHLHAYVTHEPLPEDTPPPASAPEPCRRCLGSGEIPVRPGISRACVRCGGSGTEPR